MNNNAYTLYGSDGCHLCELAQAICAQLIDAEQLAHVDIVDDEKLVELYGVHIPVLERMNDGEKLFWPFELSDVEALLN